MINLIPGKLYKIPKLTDIRTDIMDYTKWERLDNDTLVVFLYYNLHAMFLYKNNVCCLQWLRDSEKAGSILKLFI